jgi:Tfp pilus assembly protein PilW
MISSLIHVLAAMLFGLVVVLALYAVVSILRKRK